MKNTTRYFTLFIIAYFICLSSIGQASKLFVGENQLGMMFIHGEKKVLRPGAEYTKDNKVSIFNIVDSVYIDSFEVMDVKARTLQCRVKLLYAISESNLESIANSLEWVQSIKSYKRYLIIPILKGQIREQFFLIDSENDIPISDIKNKVRNKLISYVDIKRLNVSFFEK
jgi:hypothetical protein